MMFSQGKGKKLSLQMSQVAIKANVYPGFCGIK